MKKFIKGILYSSVIFLLVINAGCKKNSPAEASLPAELSVPDVKVSVMDYTDDNFMHTFPEAESHKRISDAYRNNCTDEIRQAVVDAMILKVRSLGLSESLFVDCLNATKCIHSGSIIMPSYAELAKYNGKQAWIIQFTWGMGSSTDLGHYKCFAIGTAKLDTLTWVQCR